MQNKFKYVLWKLLVALYQSNLAEILCIKEKKRFATKMKPLCSKDQNFEILVSCAMAIFTAFTVKRYSVCSSVF